MLLWLIARLPKPLVHALRRLLELLTALFLVGALVFGWLSVLRDGPQVQSVQEPTRGAARLVVQVRAAGKPLSARARVIHQRANETYIAVGEASGDATGTITLDGLPTGGAWLVVEAPGHQRRSHSLALSEGQQELSVELLPARKLSVTVRGDQHEPIANATVLVRDREPLPLGGLTDAAGRREFTRLGDAPYTVEVFARGYESASRPDVSEDLEIVLRKLGGLRIQVVGAGNEPAAGAEVFVVGSSLWPTRRLQADAQGVARLNGLFPGLYDLKAQLGARVSDVLSGVRMDRGESKEVTLRLGAGRYIDVVVLDAQQEPRYPVPDASVILTELGLSSFPITTKTDRAGRTRIGPVSRAPTYVGARAPGFIGRSAVPVPDDLDGPLEIVLLQGATLRGLVTDVDGRPIDGARVEVIGIDLDGLPIAETPLLAAYRDAHFEWSMKPLPLVPAGELGVTLGPVPFVQSILQGGVDLGWTELPEDYKPWISGYDGEFVAHPVPPGRVRALVRHPSYVEGVSEPIVLAPGGSGEVTVVLSQGGELRGRVVDEADRPVAGARIKLTALKGSFERSGISAEDGMFQFSAVPRDVSISLARPDELSQFVTREVLRLKEGETLEREFTLPEPRDTVRWEVVDEDDQAIELAQVTLMSVDPTVPLRATRFSDERGVVEFEDTAGVAVRVSVQANGFASLDEQLRAAPAERTVVLRRGVWVRGRVTAVRGRVEVAGARVVLSAGNHRDSTVTTENGTFDFREVPAGKVRLDVTHEDYARHAFDVLVERTARDTRAFELDTLDLAEAATISGVVVDADERAVAGARVGLEFLPAFLPRGRLPEGTVQTGPDGSFRLHGVAPGKHRLQVFAASKGRGVHSFEVEGGDELEDVRVQLDGTADGDELDVTGGGVAVTLGERDSREGTRVVVVQIAEGSEAERAGLKRGDLLVTIDGARPDNMRDARARLNGQPGVDLVLEITRGGRQLSFRVRREQLSH
ncbi:MAG: hypothetical protein RJA70_2574 [Pseudomonadota bacterium]|jgi:hypothetical protein